MKPKQSFILNKTALIAIDMQASILMPQPLAPYSAEYVIKQNDRLAAALKNTSSLVVLVTVDTQTMRQLYPFESQSQETMTAVHDPAYTMAIAQQFDAHNVIRVTKHNPGAFFGTDLDLQLRRHGIQNLILTGVSTSNGVYATALDAYQYGYHVMVVEDACSDRDQEKHDFFFRKMFNRIGQVTTTQALLTKLAK